MNCNAIIDVILLLLSKINWNTVIALTALGLSIYTIHRDHKIKQLEILHQSVSSIKELNRSIADTISEKGKQREVFLTELKNEYEFLCFLANNRKLDDNDIFSLEGDFLTKLVKKTSLKQADFPEIFKLLQKWEKSGKISKKDYLVI